MFSFFMKYMSKSVELMNGKRVKIESKCDMSCGVDRISQLPDNIIARILSYLWLNTAARTSVLSTRWHDLWRYTPSLYFYEMDCRRGNFIEWVNSIVENHKSHSLKNLTIYCNLDKSSHSAISKWLEFAFSKRVEKMRLIFQHNAKDNAVVLDELLRMRPSNLLKSSNLKSLYLRNLKVSGEAIKLILGDCHFLEKLMIDRAVFTSDIEVCDGATSLMLKHLEISCCSGGKWIEVSAINLSVFKVDNINREVLLWVENVPKLIEVDFGSFIACDLHEFCFVSQLQILTIGPFYPLEFLGKDIPSMPKLMELNVEHYVGRSKYLLPTLTSFIRASPLLQTFNLQFWESDNEYEEDMEVANVEAFEHQNLRVFKFYGFDVEANMEFVSFILDNCVALRKLILKVYKNMEKISPYPDWEAITAIREADMEKAKQSLQPILPAHVELQVTTLVFN